MLDKASVVGLSEAHIDFDSSDVPMHAALLKPYQRLVDAAKAQGFDLKAASGFRSFERQMRIWNAKAIGERAVLNQQGQALDMAQLDKKAQVWAILRWSALPGTSRHHWGTDIDIYDEAALANGYTLQLTVDETKEGGPFFAMYQWLDKWLAEHSDEFFRPYARDRGGIAPEPWHLSYRPLADHYAKAFDKAYVYDVIARSDLLLKDTVLQYFNDIMERFVQC